MWEKKMQHGLYLTVRDSYIDSNIAYTQWIESCGSFIG